MNITHAERAATLNTYSNHLLNLAKGAEKEMNEDDNKFFIPALISASGFAKANSEAIDVDIEDIDVSLDKQVKILLEHNRIISTMLENHNLDDETRAHLEFAGKIAIEQSQVLAKFAADEYKRLQRIEKEGVKEIKKVKMINADDVLKGGSGTRIYEPTNTATRVLKELFEGKSDE